MGRHVRDVLAVKPDRAGGRQVEAGDHPQQRGLAAAGWSEQADEGAMRHRQLDIVDRGEVAEFLRDVFEGEA